MFLFLYFGGGEVEVRTISVIINTEHCLPTGCKKEHGHREWPRYSSEELKLKWIVSFQMHITAEMHKSTYTCAVKSEGTQYTARLGLWCDAAERRKGEVETEEYFNKGKCVCECDSLCGVCVCIPDVNAYYFRLCKYVQAVNNNNRKTSKLKRYLKLLPK